MRHVVWMLALAGCTRANHEFLERGTVLPWNDAGTPHPAPGDLTERDLTGVDLAGSGPPDVDLAGLDLAGVDLAGEARDLSTVASDLAQPAGGNVPVGFACVRGDCVAGASCLSRSNSSNDGICLQDCASDADCPSQAFGYPNNVSYCARYRLDPTIRFCTIPCNPVPQAGASGCEPGMYCSYGFPPEATSCADDPVPSSANCSADLECGPGAVCYIAWRVCMTLCRQGHDEDCPFNHPYCEPFSTETVTFGYCR